MGEDEGEGPYAARDFFRAIQDSVPAINPRAYSQITFTGTFTGVTPRVPIALSGNLSASQIFPGVSSVTTPAGLTWSRI
jgi:hypothetical protein